MIFFITAYDDPTSANLDVGKQIAEGHTSLFAGDATRSNLIRLLELLKDEPLFAMSHGKPDRLMDNKREPAITTGDEPLFVNRSVYAWACLIQGQFWENRLPLIKEFGGDIQGL